jgi:hypothetical protein
MYKLSMKYYESVVRKSVEELLVLMIDLDSPSPKAAKSHSVRRRGIK